jgi:DNA polymerase III sliding clamp (beta) subunit (PCNA family)
MAILHGQALNLTETPHSYTIMQLKTQDLRRAVEVLTPLAAERSYLEVLTTFRIDPFPADGHVYISALDGQVLARIRVAAMFDPDSPSDPFLLPADKLSKLLALVREEDIRIKVQDTQIVVKHGKSSIKYTKRPDVAAFIVDRTSMGTPRCSIQLNREALSLALRSSFPLIHNDATIPHLTGVAFVKTGGFCRFEATNQQALIRVGVNGTIDRVMDDFAFIIPKSSVPHILRCIDLDSKETVVNVVPYENQIMIWNEDVTLFTGQTALPAGGKWVDFDAVLVRGELPVMAFEGTTADVAITCRRASSAADVLNDMITFTLDEDNRLHLSSESQAAASDELWDGSEIAVNLNGGPPKLPGSTGIFSVRYNGGLLKQCLAAYRLGKVKVSVGGTMNPLLLTGREGDVAVTILMNPVR